MTMFVREKRKYNARRIFSIVLFALGIAILLAFAILAIFRSQISPYSPTESFGKFEDCSKEHLLGTNNLGYDIMSQLIYAVRPTLAVALLSALICVTIGVAVGVLAGYISGIGSEALNGVINFFLLIPMLPMAIVLGAYLNGGRMGIVLTISLLCWCQTARAVRAKTMELRGSEFVKSLKSVGYSEAHVLARHVLPNVLPVAVAKFIPSVARCIMIAATLSFLGMGNLNEISLGVMINYAYNFGGLSLEKYNWLFAPGVCIMLLQIALYCVGQFFETKKSIVRESTLSDK